MQQIDITFKNEKEGTYRRMIFLLVGLHVLFFIFLLFNKPFRGTGGPGLILIGLYSVYRFIISRRTKKKFFLDPNVFFLFMIGLFW